MMMNTRMMIFAKTQFTRKNRSIDGSRGDTIGGGVPCSVAFLADRTRIEEAIPLGWEHVVARDTSATRCPETRRRGTKASELVVLRPTELVVGDEAILVLVLVLEDLLNEFVVVGHYLLHLLAVPAAALLRLDHLFPQILAHLCTQAKRLARSFHHVPPLFFYSCLLTNRTRFVREKLLEIMFICREKEREREDCIFLRLDLKFN